MRRAILALGVLGCAPILGGDPARVDAPRVLAVRSEPAEARPGDAVTLRALVASPDGETRTPSWSWCAATRPTAENRVAAEACLAGRRDALAALGTAEALDAVLPSDACALFGSEPAPAAPGEPPRRAVDPDPTGGYHQPVRVDLSEGEAALGRVRLTCALPDAPAEVARRFAAERRPNANPRVLSLGLEGLTIVVGWDAADAESYLRYERSTATLEVRREVLRVDVYASGATVGAVNVEAGRATAPVTLDGDGPPRVWAVLRDDRGGVDWAVLEVPAR